ncbi:hypothetical protein PRZ48_007851 [Zasmidium cellare]|uniref:Uncharacterized protein n=1 Tax=Zasmidium cellare TaxID=395010 RepID=A0ABR0EKK0_ZASCE|nr:hypothetical protein PRZ48_007851 [Zasmidium cellare]
MHESERSKRGREKKQKSEAKAKRREARKVKESWPTEQSPNQAPSYLQDSKADPATESNDERVETIAEVGDSGNPEQHTIRPTSTATSTRDAASTSTPAVTSAPTSAHSAIPAGHIKVSSNFKFIKPQIEHYISTDEHGNVVDNADPVKILKSFLLSVLDYPSRKELYGSLEKLETILKRGLSDQELDDCLAVHDEILCEKRTRSHRQLIKPVQNPIPPRHRPLLAHDNPPQSPQEDSQETDAHANLVHITLRGARDLFEPCLDALLRAGAIDWRQHVLNACLFLLRRGWHITVRLTVGLTVTITAGLELARAGWHVLQQKGRHLLGGVRDWTVKKLAERAEKKRKREMEEEDELYKGYDAMPPPKKRIMLTTGYRDPANLDDPPETQSPAAEAPIIHAVNRPTWSDFTTMGRFWRGNAITASPVAVTYPHHNDGGDYASFLWPAQGERLLPQPAGEMLTPPLVSLPSSGQDQKADVVADGMEGVEFTEMAMDITFPGAPVGDGMEEVEFTGIPMDITLTGAPVNITHPPAPTAPAAPAAPVSTMLPPPAAGRRIAPVRRLRNSARA